MYVSLFICMHVYTYNLNFSFHFGHNVCGLIEVALINFAGTGPPNESLCSRLAAASLRLKLNRKLCLRCLSCVGESDDELLSKPTSDNVRGVGGNGCGDTGVPVG